MRTGYPSIDKIHLQGIPEEKLHPEIYPLSMFATFMRINGEHLDEESIEENGKIYTKRNLRDDIIKTAGAFLELNLKGGDKIATHITQSNHNNGENQNDHSPGGDGR